MTTYDHHQLASMLFKEAQLDRSNLKAIFDLSTNQLTLEQAIAIAHNSLSKHDHPDAIRKLLNFRNHYFIPVEYDYPENDPYKLQEITQHSIAVIQKWALLRFLWVWNSVAIRVRMAGVQIKSRAFNERFDHPFKYK